MKGFVMVALLGSWLRNGIAQGRLFLNQKKKKVKLTMHAINANFKKIHVNFMHLIYVIFN